SFAGAAVPFSVPGKPVPVRFRSPFDQNWRGERFRVACPGAKIDIKLAGYDLLQSKFSFGMSLVDIGAQHQPDVGDFAELADPIAGLDRKLLRFEPIVGKINPRRPCAD